MGLPELCAEFNVNAATVVWWMVETIQSQNTRYDSYVRDLLAAQVKLKRQSSADLKMSASIIYRSYFREPLFQLREIRAHHPKLLTSSFLLLLVFYI